ncbi:MAG: hemerythrin domain-containing protein [Burkholderiaceae bacterium]
MNPPKSDDANEVLTWTDAFELGYGPIDDTHREFVEVVAAMQRASDAELLARLDDFARHADDHFGAEDRWMRETEFPPRDCHMGEHAAVLESLRQVRERVAAGDVAVGRGFVDALVDWFPGHADYLDSALAAWLFKRQHGGRPVVFRRDIAAGGATESPSGP